MSLIQRLKQVKFQENLIGIAASQIGSSAKVCLVMDWVFRDPSITWYSDDTSKDTEGCWSVEGQFLVERSNSIRIRYKNVNGKWKDKTLVGYAARVAQHEIDHLTDVSDDRPFGITIEDRGEKIC